MDFGTFKKDFLWGVATSAFQVEGSLLADGAGVSNWLDFCRRDGTIHNDELPDPGVDEYRRYREDVALMKRLGVKAYRFSLAWARIFPDGTGRANPKGLDYYNRLIDELLANGIEPFPTVFHWDMPMALERKGGWRNKDTAKALGDYAGFVSAHLSDRVKRFFTLNEIYCFAEQAYTTPYNPPGLIADRKTVNQVVHNACLAHGYAVRAMRANAVAPIRLGLVDNPFSCVPSIGTPENIAAAKQAFYDINSRRLAPVFEGRYPEKYLADEGENVPDYTDAEMRIISEPTDFLGLNLYTPILIEVAPDEPCGYRELPKAAGHPKMNIDWMYFGPEILYYAPKFVSELWGAKSIYITENGCPGLDKVRREDGRVIDTDRVMYLRSHLAAAAKAGAEGIPLDGYFAWSLLDNFEWGSGFSKRFGLVYVNYHSGKRIPKMSYDYFREVIAGNRVL